MLRKFYGALTLDKRLPHIESDYPIAQGEELEDSRLSWTLRRLL